MHDVRIINNEAVLFDGDIEMNLEPYRKNDDIRYDFDDDSYVSISRYNTISWHGSNGFFHRDGDIPAIILHHGDMVYCKHGKTHRENGPARIRDDGDVEYWIDDIEYTKDQYINKLNSNYGMIYYA